MPVTIHNKKYLLKRLGFKIDDETLVRNIENMGPNVKSMNDKEITVEYQANRPDIISAVGLARAIRYYMRRSRNFAYAVKEGEGATITVGKHAAKIRPYVAAILVENMELEEDDLLDIINFTEKLSDTHGRQRNKIAIGLHDLRDVEPPFFYDAYEDEKFMPLGAKRETLYSHVLRDEDKGKKYSSLCSSGGRYLALKDAKGTMALVPVINSERTRVSVSTKRMLIDITGSMKEAIDGVADLIATDFMDRGYDVKRVKVCYGKKSQFFPKLKTTEFRIPLKQLEDEIGVVIGFNNVILLANKMGHEAALIGKKIRVRVPPYRLDVINEQDIVEDVAAAYGYDYIQPVAVSSTQQGSVEKITKVANAGIEAMVGLGFNEALNSYLTNEEINFIKMRESRHEQYVNIINPKSAMATMLRTWLLPSLLSQLGKSMHDKLPLKIFELDMAFEVKKGVPEEKHHLAAVACHSQVNFNEIKAIVQTLSKKLRIVLEIEEGKHNSFIEGRCAQILSDKKIIGFMGEIHPEVLGSFGIEEPVIAFEIDLCKAGLCQEKSKQ